MVTRSASLWRRRAVVLLAALLLALLVWFYLSSLPPAGGGQGDLEWLMSMDDPYTVSTYLKQSGQLAPPPLPCHWAPHLAMTHLLQVLTSRCGDGSQQQQHHANERVSCQVLELGCVVGSSLVPLASALGPHARWYLLGAPEDWPYRTGRLVEGMLRFPVWKEEALQVRYQGGWTHVTADFDVVVLHAQDTARSHGMLERLLAHSNVRPGTLLVASGSRPATTTTSSSTSPQSALEAYERWLLGDRLHGHWQPTADPRHPQVRTYEWVATTTTTASKALKGEK